MAVVGRGGGRDRPSIFSHRGPEDDGLRAKIADVVAALTAIRCLTAAARGVSLSLIDAQVVLACAARSGATTSELARLLDLGRPRCSEALTRLRARGLVGSATPSKDGRRRRIALTAGGAKTVKWILSDPRVASTAVSLIDNAFTRSIPEQSKGPVSERQGTSKNRSDSVASVEALIAAARVSRVLNRFASKAGMEPASLHVLLAVWAEPNLTVSEVADRLGLRNTHTSDALTELDELGFVDESIDPEDARRRRKQPTRGADGLIAELLRFIDAEAVELAEAPTSQ